MKLDVSFFGGIWFWFFLLYSLNLSTFMSFWYFISFLIFDSFCFLPFLGRKMGLRGCCGIWVGVG